MSSLQQQKNIAILDFVRTPHYKLQEAEATLATSITKSCLLSLFEKNPHLKNQVRKIGLSYARKEASPQVSFEELIASLALSKDTRISLDYYGKEATVQALVTSCEEIDRDFSPLVITGGLEISSQETSISTQRKKIFLSKYQQRLKKYLPELAYLDDANFLEILNFGEIEEWQQRAYSSDCTREILDNFTEVSLLKRTKDQRKRVPFSTSAPYFHLLTEDQFYEHHTKLASIKKAYPLLKGTFSNLTAHNTALATDGSSFLVLASEKKAKEMGYPIKNKILAYKTLEEISPEVIEAFLSPYKLNLKSLDFFEIPERSALHVFLTLRKLGEPPLSKVNALGGGLSFGYSCSAEPFSAIERLSKTLSLHHGAFGLAVIQNSYKNSTLFLLGAAS